MNFSGFLRCQSIEDLKETRQDVRSENSRSMFFSYYAEFLDFFDPEFFQNDVAISRQEEIFSNRN